MTAPLSQLVTYAWFLELVVEGGNLIAFGRDAGWSALTFLLVAHAAFLVGLHRKPVR